MPFKENLRFQKIIAFESEGSPKQCCSFSSSTDNQYCIFKWIRNNITKNIYNKSDVFKNIRRILVLTDYSDHEIDRQKRLTVTNFVYRTFSSSKQHYMRTFRNACLLNTQYF